MAKKLKNPERHLKTIQWFGITVALLFVLVFTWTELKGFDGLEPSGKSVERYEAVLAILKTTVFGLLMAA